MNFLLSSLYNGLKILFTFLDAILFVLLFSVFAAGSKFRPKLELFNPEERTFTLGTAVLKERWEAILKKAEGDSLEAVKLAIIDADNFIDDILRRMGIEGAHIADRLEQLSRDDFVSLERLWNAHRVRNRLVHEPDFKISAEEGMRTLKNYESFLKEVEAI